MSSTTPLRRQPFGSETNDSYPDQDAVPRGSTTRTEVTPTRGPYRLHDSSVLGREGSGPERLLRPPPSTTTVLVSSWFPTHPRRASYPRPTHVPTPRRSSFSTYLGRNILLVPVRGPLVLSFLSPTILPETQCASTGHGPDLPSPGSTLPEYDGKRTPGDDGRVRGEAP